jgi:DivIVA domain-containing protein
MCSKGDKSMKIETKLNANKILDKEFAAKKTGYDALEVDKFLDAIVEDYSTFESYIKELENKVDELSQTLKLYKSRMDNMEIQNAVMSDKLSNISNNEACSLSNIDLLKRISVLEHALYKAGVDPTKIK